MCGPASGWSKLALVVLVIGLGLHIAGWATMYWSLWTNDATSQQINIGLWRQRTCAGGTCTEEGVEGQYETAAFNAVRAFETICFCLVVLGCILLLIYTCATMKKRNVFAIVILVICYIAAICSFVGMVVHIVEVPNQFEISWSLGLTVIAMTLISIAGTLMIPDAFDDSEYEPEEEEEDDDFFGTRRRGEESSGYPRGPPSRGITPLKPGFRRY